MQGTVSGPENHYGFFRDKKKNVYHYYFGRAGDKKQVGRAWFEDIMPFNKSLVNTEQAKKVKCTTELEEKKRNLVKKLKEVRPHREKL